MPGDDLDEPSATITMSDNLRADEQGRPARQVVALAAALAADVERWAAQQGQLNL